jgi:hypothetical protein
LLFEALHFAVAADRARAIRLALIEPALKRKRIERIAYFEWGFGKPVPTFGAITGSCILDKELIAVACAEEVHAVHVRLTIEAEHDLDVC